MMRAGKTRLDDFDIKIVQLNLMPRREISDRVGLSAAAVARRLKRLRSTGIIRKDISILNERAVGRPQTVFVEVTAKNGKLELLDGMKRRFLNCPQVQQCYHVTGEADFLLIITTIDMDEYTSLTRQLFFKKGNVKSFRTCVMMEEVKSVGPIPL
ncbi:Lrp/AsnC family transcriptional regulator [Mesorhizobium sp. AR02]|uniref:Lrp/AsnC family transcriptional regulator n=1 Tax=Mesorhizobium sp. AR02 TaxID=2865837 RepID=UPI00215F7320|nr:Lrp/AsnC family transcriptional regulator [Mesorhizobium sp. AR02]UVK50428.1 Lrp/AsnC family transcriptional regulator [Mesorhizobium sp. AR02]